MATRPRDFKPLKELDWARTTLTAARFAFDGLAVGADPPDCVAVPEGARAGIEVTELVDAEARKRTRAGNWSLSLWGRGPFLTRIQEIIDAKAAKPFQGGPYARKMLVIWTDEFMLSRQTVEGYLAGQSFSGSAFDDVVLGLDYHPDHQYVAYRLALGPSVT
jgi:hypothetical protein